MSAIYTHYWGTFQGRQLCPSCVVMFVSDLFVSVFNEGKGKRVLWSNRIRWELHSVHSWFVIGLSFVFVIVIEVMAVYHSSYVLGVSWGDCMFRYWNRYITLLCRLFQELLLHFIVIIETLIKCVAWKNFPFISCIFSYFSISTLTYWELYVLL
jgi:hypothetical protein